MFLRIKIISALLIACGCGLINANFTDADFADEFVVGQNGLVATTLALSSLNTINEETIREM